MHSKWWKVLLSIIFTWYHNTSYIWILNDEKHYRESESVELKAFTLDLIPLADL